MLFPPKGWKLSFRQSKNIFFNFNLFSPLANKRIPLESNRFYHIYNHAVHLNNLFSEAKDYALFLMRLEEYILPIADIYAYCLMPNHYHLLLQIKDFETLKTFFWYSDKFCVEPHRNIENIA